MHKCSAQRALSGKAECLSPGIREWCVSKDLCQGRVTCDRGTRLKLKAHPELLSVGHTVQNAPWEGQTAQGRLTLFRGIFFQSPEHIFSISRFQSATGFQFQSMI